MKRFFLLVLQATFLVGDIVCFSTPVLSATGSKGKWAADPKLLDIDPETGIALVLGVGETEVFYSVSDKHVTSTEVRINASSHLDFESSEQQFITDARRSVIPLSFRQSGKNLIGDSCSADDVARFLRNKNLPLNCQVSFAVENDVKVDDVLSARVEFDVKSGSYQCGIKPVAMVSTASSSIAETDVVLKAQYAGTVTAQLSLPFEPSFHAITDQVHVSDLQPNTHIVIVGKPSVLQVVIVHTVSSTHLILIRFYFGSSNWNSLQVIPPLWLSTAPNIYLRPTQRSPSGLIRATAAKTLWLWPFEVQWQVNIWTFLLLWKCSVNMSNALLLAPAGSLLSLRCYISLRSGLLAFCLFWGHLLPFI